MGKLTSVMGWQTPATQAPPRQLREQEPQAAPSVWRSTHVPLHVVVPAGHAHTLL